jgi:HK97 family phage portal protein
MLHWLGKTLQRFGTWLKAKGAPIGLTGPQWSGSSAIDNYKRHRQPTPNELLQELKSTAWTCASINAATCAAYPPSVYVTTKHNQPRPKCATRPLTEKAWKHLHRLPHLEGRCKTAAHIEEITDHPLVTLLNAPTAPINTLGSFDLWELTTLYQEVIGSAYWYLEKDPLLDVPIRIWVLPSQNVTPMREANSPNLVDYFRYRTGTTEQRFDPSEIIHFRYPDPRDPYTSGYSPLRACFEQVAMTSEYSAFKRAKFDNYAIPDALLSPAEVIGEEERDRLESQWNQRFRKGGAGRVIVAESPLQMQLMQHSMGDLAALADMNATRDMIANAFHVPTAFFTTQTNLANLVASQNQHMSQAIGPRLNRRDEKLNETLVPLFDPTGRIFLASQDPVPVDQDASLQQTAQDLQYGVLTINEIRSGRGLPPMPWGNVPWLPQRWLPTDVPRVQPGEQGEPGPSANDGDPGPYAAKQ